MGLETLSRRLMCMLACLSGVVQDLMQRTRHLLINLMRKIDGENSGVTCCPGLEFRPHLSARILLGCTQQGQQNAERLATSLPKGKLKSSLSRLLGLCTCALKILGSSTFVSVFRCLPGASEPRNRKQEGQKMSRMTLSSDWVCFTYYTNQPADSFASLTVG